MDSLKGLDLNLDKDDFWQVPQLSDHHSPDDAHIFDEFLAVDGADTNNHNHASFSPPKSNASDVSVHLSTFTDCPAVSSISNVTAAPTKTTKGKSPSMGAVAIGETHAVLGVMDQETLQQRRRLLGDPRTQKGAVQPATASLNQISLTRDAVAEAQMLSMDNLSMNSPRKPAAYKDPFARRGTDSISETAIHPSLRRMPKSSQLGQLQDGSQEWWAAQTVLSPPLSAPLLPSEQMTNIASFGGELHDANLHTTNPFATSQWYNPAIAPDNTVGIQQQSVSSRRNINNLNLHIDPALQPDMDQQHVYPTTALPLGNTNGLTIHMPQPRTPSSAPALDHIAAQFLAFDTVSSQPQPQAQDAAAMQSTWRVSERRRPKPHAPSSGARFQNNGTSQAGQGASISPRKQRSSTRDQNVPTPPSPTSGNSHTSSGDGVRSGRIRSTSRSRHAAAKQQQKRVGSLQSLNASFASLNTAVAAAAAQGVQDPLAGMISGETVWQLGDMSPVGGAGGHQLRRQKSDMDWKAATNQPGLSHSKSFGNMPYSPAQFSPTTAALLSPGIFPTADAEFFNPSTYPLSPFFTESRPLRSARSTSHNFSPTRKSSSSSSHHLPSSPRKSRRNGEPSSSRERGGIGFVNYTPNDHGVLMTGVAPSGSSKTKARREKEATERQRRLSEAVVKVARKAGVDVRGVLKEEGLAV